MFRYALKPKALSSLRGFTTVNRLSLGRLSGSYHLHGLRNHELSSHGLTSHLNRSQPPIPNKRSGSSLSFNNDTIYALSSAQGKAGIAVIRISGPGCKDVSPLTITISPQPPTNTTQVYKSLCPSHPLPKPRFAAVRTLYQPSTTNIVDSSSLVLHFPGPRTVTGEDILELHVHGGTATVRAVLTSISQTPSSVSRIRYAEPGEFTKRAFLNDRLDLAQVEALSDTLSAETEQQRRAAVRGASGELGRIYEGWRTRLLLARAEIEALIDFSEDQHFDESPTELLSNVSKIVDGILHSIGLHEMASQRTELLRNGIRIALLGPPNAGKSSLMNLIVGREASIVSSEAGTTRDVVEASLDIRGFLCSFADTAGFRTGGGEGGVIGMVEEEGIRRARGKAEEADVVIALASVEGTGGGRRIVFDEETLRLAGAAEQCLVVVNKADAVADEGELKVLLDDFKTRAGMDRQPLTISCREAVSATTRDTSKDPGGIHALISTLAQSFSNLTALPDDMQDLLGVTERQRQLLVECRGYLEEFVTEAKGGVEKGEADVVLAAEHLRAAANCLARITGRGEAGDVEEVLGVIFEK